MRESGFYKAVSFIHVSFFLSILCFGTIFLSLTILMVPALTATFMIGKELIYREYDITDSLIKKYFRYLRQALPLEKYVVINLVATLNIAGILAGIRMEQTGYAIACLTITAILYTLILYLAGYYTYVERKFTLTDVFICMMYKPGFMLPILIVMILTVFFFRALMAKILLVIGAIPILVLELTIMLHMLHYRKLKGDLPEDDMYAHLVIKDMKDKTKKGK